MTALRASFLASFRRALTIPVIAGMLLIAAQDASADTRVGGGGNVPFYARLSRTELDHTDDWAVIEFYRPPECIPAEFNLLDFYDIPGAFSCTPYTTDGFAVWKSTTDAAPKLSQLHGLGAVPVWFVRWPDLQAAISDDVLTIGELDALQPHKGSASFFKEELRPNVMVLVSTLTSDASGVLEDGRSFHVVIQGAGFSAAPVNLETHVLIEFR